jgi:hypothetical protein
MKQKDSHLPKEQIPVVASNRGYEGRFIEWGGFIIAFEKWLEELDETNMFKDLPNGCCPCPHWGYLFKGRMTVRYKDHTETIGAGEAYYLKPGHNSIITKGTESMEVSPKREYEEAINAIKNTQSTNH